MTVFLGQIKEKKYIQNHDLRAELLSGKEVLRDWGTDHTPQPGETNLQTARRLDRDFKIYTLNSTTVNETTIENMIAVRDHLTNNTMDPSKIKEINKIFNESILPKLEKAKISTPLTFRKVLSSVWNIGAKTISALFRASTPIVQLDVEIKQNIPTSPKRQSTETTKTPTPQPTLETPKPTIEYPTIREFKTKFPDISKAILERFDKNTLSELTIKEWNQVFTAFRESSLTLRKVPKPQITDFLEELKKHVQLALGFKKSSPGYNKWLLEKFPKFNILFLQNVFSEQGKLPEKLNPEEWNFIYLILSEYTQSREDKQIAFVKEILIEKFEAEFSDISQQAKKMYSGRSIGQLNREEAFDLKQSIKKNTKEKKANADRGVLKLITNIALALEDSTQKHQTAQYRTKKI